MKKEEFMVIFKLVSMFGVPIAGALMVRAGVFSPDLINNYVAGWLSAALLLYILRIGEK